MNQRFGKILIICMLPFLIRCSSLPESYSKGEDELEKKNIASAAKYFEEANKSKKDNSKIENILAQTNYEYFKQLVKESAALSSLDLNNKVEKHTIADKQIESAILLGKKKHKTLVADGPSMMESLSLKMDSKYQTQAMKLATLIKKQEAEQIKNKADLKIALANQSKVEAATTKLEKMSKKKPEKAWQDFSEYTPYSAFMPTVATKQDEIQSRLVNFHFEKGMSYLQKRKVAPAKDEFKKGLETQAENNKSLAGLECANAVEMNDKSNFQQAYINIKKSESIFPENAQITQFKKEISANLLSNELKTAKELAQHQKIEKNILAFQHYRFVSSLADELDPSLKEKMLKEENKLKSVIAKKLVSQAESYEKKDLVANSALILRNYQLANYLDPNLLKNKISKAILAKEVTNQKDTMRVLLYDERDSKNTDIADAGIILTEGLIKNLTDLKNQKIKGLSLQTRDDLPVKTSKKGVAKAEILGEKQIPYSIAEVVIHNQIDDVDFAETGRDQPRQKSSQYISGQRWVHNPNYDVAYRNWENEDRNYRYQSQQREQALRSCDQMANAFAQGICRGAIQGLSSYSRDAARATLENTPREVAENIISSYRYTTYNIKVKGKVVASVSFFDKRQGIALPSQKFEVLVDKEGIINEEVEATDQNGVVGGSINVPDLIAERDQAKREITQKIATSVNEAITKHYYNRYCQVGEALAKKKKIAEAAESFLLCQNLALQVSGTVESPLAQTTIDQAVGLNQEEAIRYAYVPETKTTEETSRAPASAEMPEDQTNWPQGTKELDSKTKSKIEKYMLKK